MPYIAPAEIGRAFGHVRKTMEAYAALSDSAQVCHREMTTSDYVTFRAPSLGGQHEFEEASVAMRFAVSVAREEAGPTLDELHAILTEPVTVEARPAPSHAEGILRVSERILQLRITIRELERPTLDLKNQLGRLLGFRRCRYEQVEASLVLEEARLKKAMEAEAQALDLSGDDPHPDPDDKLLRGPLRQLSGRGRTIMAMLLRARGEYVLSADIAYVVWGEDVRPGTIHEAVRRLKVKLHELGAGDVADRIVGKAGGYTLAMKNLPM